jgi:hypothetical protein
MDALVPRLRAAWTEKAARKRWLWLLASLCAGSAYVYIFKRFAPLPAAEYSYRDDAVITLSHAKNLVEYGAIGVDAAGARVEGFSTPLQFWVFALAYAITRCGYPAFLDAQVTCCNFLLGVAVLALFRPRPWLGLALSLAIGLWLTTCVRFFGWHGSGMENAYMHVLFVALLAGLMRSLALRQVPWQLIALSVLASLVRLESIVHVLPLLAIWAGAYWVEHRSLAAVRGSALALLGFGLYQAWRVLYFGSFTPNTGIAEGVDVLASVRGLVTGHLPEQAKQLAALRQIAGEHRAYLALAGLPLFAFGRRDRVRSTLVLMLASLACTGLLHPLLFGSARLDPVRTTSHVALIAPLLVSTQLCALPRWPARLMAAAALAPLLYLYLRFEPPSDKFFCCPIVRADRITDTCLAHAAAQELVNPSLANPDLGRVSFRKQLLLFDVGLLGSPPLARLRGDHAATARYLIEFAQPDFVELHGGWSCEYEYVLRDARFLKRYAPVPAGQKLGLGSGCRGGAGIWFRKDMTRDSGSPERQLHDALRKKLEPARIAAELERCEREPDRLACLYVVRGAYRMLPQLAQRGQLEAVLRAFEGKKLRDYAVNVLDARHRGRWYEPVIDLVRSR